MEELYHYGVLGMKWGRRRARNMSDKAKSANTSAKDWERKAKEAKQQGNNEKAAKYTQRAKDSRSNASKYAAKSKQIVDKHIRLAGGKKAYDYTTQQSTGKLVVKSLLMGTYGALKYNQAKSKGLSKGKAAVRGVLYDLANTGTSGIMGIVEPRVSNN